MIPAGPMPSSSSIPTDVLHRLSRYTRRSRFVQCDGVARHDAVMVALSLGLTIARCAADPDPTRPRIRKIGRPTPPGGPTPRKLDRAPGKFCSPPSWIQREQQARVQRPEAEYGALIQPAAGRAALRWGAVGAPLGAGAARVSCRGELGPALSRRWRHVDHGRRVLGGRGRGQAGKAKAHELDLHRGRGLRALVVVERRDGLDDLDGLQCSQGRLVLTARGSDPAGGQQVFREPHRRRIQQAPGLSERFLDRSRRGAQQPRDLARRAAVAREHFGVDRFGQRERCGTVARASRLAGRIATLAGLEGTTARRSLGGCRRLGGHARRITQDRGEGYHGRIAAERI
jgi:hypothetical protein